MVVEEDSPDDGSSQNPVSKFKREKKSLEGRKVESVPDFVSPSKLSVHEMLSKLQGKHTRAESEQAQIIAASQPTIQD